MRGHFGAPVSGSRPFRLGRTAKGKPIVEVAAVYQWDARTVSNTPLSFTDTEVLRAFVNDCLAALTALGRLQENDA